MTTLFNLVNKYFWKGIIGPVFAFIVPPILVFFLGIILGPLYIMPTGMMIPILTMSLIFVPQSIFEFKNSSLLKRIGTTPINPIKFLVVIILYNILIIIASFIFLFCLSFAIFAVPTSGHDQLYDYYRNGQLIVGWMSLVKSADWPSFIYGTILVILMSMAIGVCISTFARSTLFIQGIGITVTLISFFIAPVVLPVSMVYQFDIIKYIGYFLPLKYPISLVVESFGSGDNNLLESSIWDINTNYVIKDYMGALLNGQLPKDLVIYEPYDKVLNQLLPYIFIIIFVFIACQKFTWSNRSSKKINWKIFIRLFKKEKEINRNIYLNNDKSKNILEIHNITKIFDTKQGKLYANNNLTFNIQRMKNTAILGSNGSGKTTLVEMIVGLNKPNSGHFKYAYKFDKNYQEGIGIQFQDSSYPYGLRCCDIVKFIIKTYDLKFTEHELNELITKFGIETFYKKNASSLSGGQQQRLNLLLSLIHKPKILFLDELSTGLDIQIRNNIKTFIKQYAKQNKITLVIISHDMNEVEYLCENVVILNNGVIKEITTIKNIKKKYKDLETYVSKMIKN